MLQKGDKIPFFTLQNQEGENVSIQDYIGSPMVIYFYPMDDTPGCTKQACSFRDSFQDFTDKGVLVFGISADSVKKHKKFATKHNLPYTLLADTKKEVCKAFGVKGSLFGLLPGRVTFIVDKTGTIVYVFDNQFQAEKHIDKSLEIIAEL